VEKKEGESRGVNVLNDDDCKTMPTLMQILAMRCYASNGEVHARSIYRFNARWINVTHGLCDAERLDKAPHSLMLKFNFRGNRPESDKLGHADQQVTMPNHLQPVFIVSLRYRQLWDATAASTTQPWCGRRRRPRHSRGRSMSISTSCTGSTRSRLRTPTCTARCTSASSTHQSLLSEAAAKYLDKLHQLPDRLLTKKMGTTALYRYCSTVLYIFSEEKMEKTG